MKVFLCTKKSQKKMQFKFPLLGLIGQRSRGKKSSMRLPSMITHPVVSSFIQTRLRRRRPTSPRKKMPTFGNLSHSSKGSIIAAKKKRATPTAGSESQKTYTQTYLDFGQKSHGQRTLCSKCGLLYVNGEMEDEKHHATFCRSSTAGLSFPGWKSER